MRHLTIYNRDVPPKLIAEHPNVTGSNVTMPGVLVLNLDVPPGSGLAERVAYAPGYWGMVAESGYDDAAPAAPSPAAGTDEPTKATGVYPVVPMVPGPAAPDEPERRTTDDELADLLGPTGQLWCAPGEVPWAGSAAPTDRDRLAVAMLVHCQCDAMRCPVVTNPATADERRWWQRRQHGGGSHALKAPEPEPLKRCIELAGHSDEFPHHWHEGGWPFGPGNHHPRCPRHPDNYNRPGSVPVPGEGQAHAPGITPADAPAQLPAEPDLPQTHPLTDRPDPALARPYILSGPDDEPYLKDVRRTFSVCAVEGPDGYPFPVWCNNHPRHIEEVHTMDRPGGERIIWARRRGAAVPS